MGAIIETRPEERSEYSTAQPECPMARGEVDVPAAFACTDR